MSRGFWIVLPCAVAATLLIFAAWYPYTNGGRQQYNMQRAEERLPSVQAILDADPRFKEVHAWVYTGQDGAVGLFGRVETADDLFRLMRAVASERLPVAVHWQVQVRSDGGRSSVTSREPLSRPARGAQFTGRGAERHIAEIRGDAAHGRVRVGVRHAGNPRRATLPPMGG